MIDLTPIFDKILAHAQETPERECCGFATVPKGKLRYHPCRNIAVSALEFQIHPEDYIKAEADGIVAVVHSHLHGSPEPSMADRAGCEKSGLPWFIIALPTAAYKVITPEGYKAPLLGRTFTGGLLDCFALAKDYFASIGIDVPEFEREPDWWEDPDTNLLIPENFAKAGFRILPSESLMPDDVIVMQNGVTAKANHIGVYLGDGVFLHHSKDRLSCRQPYGGYWQKNTSCILRHESRC